MGKNRPKSDVNVAGAKAKKGKGKGKDKFTMKSYEKFWKPVRAALKKKDARIDALEETVEKIRNEFSEVKMQLKKKTKKCDQLNNDLHKLVDAEHLREELMHKYSDDEDE